MRVVPTVQAVLEMCSIHAKDSKEFVLGKVYCIEEVLEERTFTLKKVASIQGKQVMA